MSFAVRTNKVGESNSSWAGQVAYRLEDLNAAWRRGEDLECLCANEWPKKMVIKHADIYKRIVRRTKLNDGRYGQYELAYLHWLPNYDGDTPIDLDTPQRREPLPNQKTLF